MNNYNYVNYDWYRKSNIDKINNLYNPKEGFEKGNMFPNIYSEYKNYKPLKPKINNEREKLLYDISTICFATHELNLYLDLNPNDMTIIQLYNDYKNKESQLVEEYERKFGPLITSSIMKEPFSWEEDKWPWEVE